MHTVGIIRGNWDDELFGDEHISRIDRQARTANSYPSKDGYFRCQCDPRRSGTTRVSNRGIGGIHFLPQVLFPDRTIVGTPVGLLGVAIV